MSARLEYASEVVLIPTREVDLCSLRWLEVGIGKIVTVVKPNIVVAVNHDATAFSAKHLIVPHTSMSGEIVLEANEDALA